jgi:hypothetical protein
MLVAKNKFGATVALQTVYDWAVANQTSFWGRHQGSDTDPRTPIHGWAGAWKSKDWNYIAYIEEKLHEILKAGGFDTEAIIKADHAEEAIPCHLRKLSPRRGKF